MAATPANSPPSSRTTPCSAKQRASASASPASSAAKYAATGPGSAMDMAARPPRGSSRWQQFQGENRFDLRQLEAGGLGGADERQLLRCLPAVEAIVSRRATGVPEQATPLVEADRRLSDSRRLGELPISSVMREPCPTFNLSSRWLPLGYPFKVPTRSLLSGPVRTKTIAPLGHLRAGLVVGERSE